MGFDIVAFFAGAVAGGIIGGCLVYAFNKSVLNNLIKTLENETKNLENVASKFSDVARMIDSIYDYVKKIHGYVDNVYDNVRNIRSDLDDIMVLLSEKFKWNVRIEMRGNEGD